MTPSPCCVGPKGAIAEKPGPGKTCNKKRQQCPMTHIRLVQLHNSAYPSHSHGKEVRAKFASLNGVTSPRGILFGNRVGHAAAARGLCDTVDRRGEVGLTLGEEERAARSVQTQLSPHPPSSNQRQDLKEPLDDVVVAVVVAPHAAGELRERRSRH